jgi:hypothetical protein
MIHQLLRELPALLRVQTPVGKLWIVELGRLRIFRPEEEE